MCFFIFILFYSFGYDTGVISGVLVMPTFSKTFGISNAEAADVKGNVVALLQVGCCVGALFINFVAGMLSHPDAVLLYVGSERRDDSFSSDGVILTSSILTDYFGRKKAIFLSALVFIVGGIIQVVSAGSLGMLIGGRFVAGGEFIQSSFSRFLKTRIKRDVYETHSYFPVSSKVGIGASSMLVPM